jgi:two-component system nitrate/nitrite response regulator NarL
LRRGMMLTAFSSAARIAIRHGASWRDSTVTKLILLADGTTMLRQRSFAVILVGRSILLREGLAKILRAANFCILASVSSADDLRPSKAKLYLPLYLIVQTGDDFDIALEQIAFFRNQHPDARIAIVANHYRLNELTSAFRAGANGYFVNVITCDRFIKSLELVMMGETIFPPALLDANRPHLVEDATSDRNGTILVAKEDATAPLLSPQEKVILRCLIEGDSNRCIARKIDVTEGTVKVHVKAILRKIEVQNRTQAAVWGLNNGYPARSRRMSVLTQSAEAKIASSIPTGRLREG